MGLRQRTAKNLGWIALSQGLSVALNAVVMLVLASVLSTADFGVYAACTTVNAILLQLTILGLDYAVINSKDRWGTVVSSGGMLRLVLSGAAFVVIVLLSGFLSDFFGIADLSLPIIVTSTTVLFLATAFVPQMNLTKNLRFKELSVAKVAASLTWAVLGLSLAFAGFSYWSLVVAFTVSQISSLVVIYIYSRERLTKDVDRAVAAKLVRFGGITSAGLFMGILSGNVDKFIVGSTTNADALGIYWAMYLWGTTAPSWLTSIINTVMFPTYSLLNETPSALKKAYSETLRLVSEFSAPVSMGLAGGSALFVNVFLGSGWEDGIESLSFLALAGFFISMTSPAGNVFISTGRPDLIFSITLVFLAPTIPVAILACQEWGIVGVSAVIMVYEGCKSVYVIHRAGRIVGTTARDVVIEVMPFMTAGLAVGIGVWAISEALGATFFSFIVAIAAGILLYLGISAVLSKGRLLKDIREVWGMISRKVQNVDSDES